MDQLREYYQAKASRYDELALTYDHPNWYKRWFYRTRSRAVLEVLSPRPGDVVLDVGCGPGHYGRAIVERGATVISLDLAPGYLLQSSSGVLKGRLVCGDAAALPFANSSFTKVLAAEILEHTLEPARVLAEIRRVVRAGGQAIITAPSARSYMDKMYDFKRRIYRYAFNEHLQEFSPESFVAILRDHFDVLSLRFANFLLPFPLDGLAMRLPRSTRLAIDCLERFLEASRAGPWLGWTMIAECQKPGQ